jgi:predicted ABC-type sugar transport system permease subunit
VAARFSGIRVDATKLWIYAGTGFLAALAAVIFVSRVTTTRSDMGTGLELDVITGVVLGGTSIFGGRGTMKASHGARRSVNGEVIVSYRPHWSSHAMKRMRVPSLNQPTMTKAW